MVLFLRFITGGSFLAKTNLQAFSILYFCYFVQPIPLFRNLFLNDYNIVHPDYCMLNKRIIAGKKIRRMGGWMAASCCQAAPLSWLAHSPSARAHSKRPGVP